MVRIVIVAVIWIFSASTGVARANTSTYCDGRYALAVEMIDKALAPHQTLYSGGNHFHYSNDHVGATLDIYRLLIGAPDIGLRERKTRNYAPWDDDAETRWAKSRWVFDATTSGPVEENERSYAALALDLLTSIGPTPDWWLRPDDFDDLGDNQKFVAEAVRDAPALDWLQTVLAASDAPWAIHWHSAPVVADYAAYERLAARAEARFKADNGLVWLAAASLIEPSRPRQRLDAVDKELRRLESAVLHCEATPAEYAAFALADSQYRRGAVHPKSRVFASLPISVRLHVATQTAYKNVLYRWGRRGPKKNVDVGFYEDVAAGQAGADYFDLAKFYQAESVLDIPISENAYVLRAYNILSTADLTVLAKREGVPSFVAGAAFARSIALGKWEQAGTLVKRLQAAYPDHADEIAGYWGLDTAERVKLALIAVKLSVSAHICGGLTYGDYALGLYHRNVCAKYRELPLEYAGLGALQRDLEVWLGARPEAYRHMRGYSIPAVERRYYRGRRFSHAHSSHVPIRLHHSYQLTRQSPSDRLPPFVSLVAWDELGRLVEKDRLMPMTADILIEWAGAKTRGRDRLYSEKADALARLIRLCRYDDCGEIGGAPAQARAHKILHQKFPETGAAENTPYWWSSRRAGLYSK